jgi:hypothetical protein
VCATIAGTRVDRLILDTGAGISLIEPGVAARLRCTKLPETIESVDGAGVRSVQELVEVESLCLFARASNTKS